MGGPRPPLQSPIKNGSNHHPKMAKITITKWILRSPITKKKLSNHQVFLVPK